jgi:hypothetical protein
VKIDGSSTAAIGPSLGNGTASNGGAGIALSGSGSGTGAGSGSGAGSGNGSGSGGCQDYPDTVGCSEFGVPDALGANPVSIADSGFSGITSVAFASTSSCPANLNISVLGRSYSISYAGLCQVLNDFVKPILLVIAAATTAFIFVGGFKV